MALEHLANMEYPGRVIIVGQSPNGHRVALYAVTGRSPSSQARKLVREGNGIFVQPTDEEVLRTGNRDLLVYCALCFQDCIAVSNGKQTEDVYREISGVGDPAEKLKRAHQRWEYEPDPNWTPRISALVTERTAVGIIRKGDDGFVERQFFSYPLLSGYGQMIATYTGVNVDPLPSWQGMPVWTDIPWESVDEAVGAVFEALRPDEGRPDIRVAVGGVYLYGNEQGSARTAIKNRLEPGK